MSVRHQDVLAALMSDLASLEPRPCPDGSFTFDNPDASDEDDGYGGEPPILVTTVTSDGHEQNWSISVEEF